MGKRKSNIHIILVLIIALVALFLVIYNVYMVTIRGIHLNSMTDITQYSNTANTKTTVLEARRGFIYDRNGNIIAQDEKTYTMYAILSKDRPNSGTKAAYVEDIYYAAHAISEILECSEDTLLNYLNQDKYQVEFGSIGRNIKLDKKEAIEALDIGGIEFRETTNRSYPLGKFASHLVGFAQYNSDTDSLVGKMGIEQQYNSLLTGENGYTKVQVNTEGYALPGSEEVVVNADNGCDIYLTIDKGIQEELEHSLEYTINERKAELAWGAVMECETGKILAYGSSNGFDPNILNIEDYTNMGTQYTYEPGSTMKTFTYAAAIDSGVYDGESMFDSSNFIMGIENGKAIRLSPSSNRTVYGTITNARNNTWGRISYDLGYRYSSNVGIASLLTTSLSVDTFEKYLDEFHFFTKVNFEGFQEETGVKNMTYPIDQLAAGYGQGLSVTMIQMLQAYTAIFNDGVMVKPYVVQQIKDPDTKEITYLADTTIVNTPIKESTAKQLQQLMWDVVNTSDGTGKYYQTTEVELIGKTGTAQIATKKGSDDDNAYSKDIVISSAMLAFPADDPKMMVYYAFKSDYAKDLHSETTAVTNIVKKAAINCGYTKPVKSEDVNDEIRDVEVYTMENLVNHTLDYAYHVNEDKNIEYVILGNGKQVVDQYPDSGSIITSGQRILLLTSEDEIQMPDITGYNRKEVMALWKLCGLAVQIEGQGKVVNQSIPVGNLIYSNSLLEVKMEE